MPRDDDEKVFEDPIPFSRFRLLADLTAMLLRMAALSIKTAVCLILADCETVNAALTISTPPTICSPVGMMPRGAKGSQNDPKVGPLGRGLGGKGTGTYFNIVTQATNSKGITRDSSISPIR